MKMLPVYNLNTKDSFCEEAPLLTVIRGSLMFQTSMLKTNTAQNYKKLMQIQDFFNENLLSQHDIIQQSPRVTGVLFKYTLAGQTNSGLYYLETAAATFLPTSQQDSSVCALDYKGRFTLGVEPAFNMWEQQQDFPSLVEYYLSGAFNHNTGDFQVNGTASVKPEYATNLQVVGFDLEIDAFHPNRPR